MNVWRVKVVCNGTDDGVNVVDYRSRNIMQNVFLFNLGANEHININGSGILGAREGGGVADDNEVQEVDPLVIFIGFELIIIGIMLLTGFLLYCYSSGFNCFSVL
ncbi:transmembrane protein, putative [Medicago truncatula]|uniref:Transmembrane protein, putative n=1 Tax=Medicago truncatula TaxID=3880 RepID=A0A072VKX0_MEDTR|nr:transmembrane protein, putative [Medicago truncatula]